VRISFRKISDDRHELAIERDGRSERMACETRSFLRHDLLHYAVEGEGGRSAGFWGLVAGGRTLVEMKDDAAALFADGAGELPWIERVVGALHGVGKGRSPEQLVAGIRSMAGSLGSEPPAWLTVELVERVEERMRQLLGHWRATPYGGCMELAWPLPR